MENIIILIAVIVGFILGRVKEVSTYHPDLKRGYNRILEAIKNDKIKVFPKKEPKAREEEVLDKLKKDNA